MKYKIIKTIWMRIMSTGCTAIRDFVLQLPVRKMSCFLAGMLLVLAQATAFFSGNPGAVSVKSSIMPRGHLNLESPDKTYMLLIDIGETISYQVLYKGKKVLSAPDIGLELPSGVLGSEPQMMKTFYRKVDTVDFPVHGDFNKLNDRYNQLTINFKGHFSLIFRAYELGVAYRFVTSGTDSLTVVNERANFKLEGAASADIAMTDNLTAWELPYSNYNSLKAVPDSLKAITPALFTLKEAGYRIVIAEADVRSYPGMYLTRNGDLLNGHWAAYPKKTVMGSWGDFVSVVRTRENYIAKVPGVHAFPWRVIIASDHDASLLSNKLIYLLGEPSKLADTKWIKPGKATWEWWHDAILPGVDMPSGMDNRNTALYNYYVDFAARHGLEYLMIDAGWSNVYDIKRPNPQIDIKEVIERAKSKRVGVFLWCVASSLLNDLPGNLDYLAGLGASGLKVDFFDRDDQVAAQWMERIAREAAARHLLIDFHGCTKPSGLERTYPNIVNYEAVRGAECDKWDTTANPFHHLTIPFIRMLAGPMDYTPGAMRNKTKASFKPIGKGLPSAMGTRCHELAMYVIFDQPLAMLCDAPSVYEQYPDILGYLSRVPTTFDDTKVLGASLGNYAVLAKQSGKDWYIGAMTNWDARNIKVDLSFLPRGKKYTATIFRDGPNAAQDATAYTVSKIPVTSRSKLNVYLASGGGAAMYLTPED